VLQFYNTLEPGTLLGTISFIAAPSPSGIPPETLTAPYNFGGECGFAMIWLLLAIAVVTAVLYLSYNRV